MHGRPTLKYRVGKAPTESGVEPKSKYIPPKNRAEATSRMVKDMDKVSGDSPKFDVVFPKVLN